MNIYVCVSLGGNTFSTFYARNLKSGMLLTQTYMYVNLKLCDKVVPELCPGGSTCITDHTEHLKNSY